MIAAAWGWTGGLLALVGLLSMLILAGIIADLLRVKTNIPDSLVIGVLTLYVVGSILAGFGIIFSLAVSAIVLLLG